MIDARLLSPDDAARYLGLPSRWSVYRLVKSGQLASVPIAGKLRLDRADLDALVDRMKELTRTQRMPSSVRPVRAVPQQLAPLRSRRSVTMPVTAPRREA